MKHYKGYVIGILIGASLMFSAQSFAEDGLNEIKALLRTGLNITLDGSKVELDNPSINYNGSTYIKLRDAGKLTGTGVVWNEKTQTVEMSSVGTSQGKVDALSSTEVKSVDENKNVATQLTTPNATGTFIDGERVIVIGVDKQDGGYDDIILNEIRYKNVIRIIELLSHKYKLEYDGTNNIFSIYDSSDNNKKSVISDIPHIQYKDRSYVRYQYYLDNIANLK